jgi:hypothetical protein
MSTRLHLDGMGRLYRRCRIADRRPSGFCRPPSVTAAASSIAAAPRITTTTTTTPVAAARTVSAPAAAAPAAAAPVAAVGPIAATPVAPSSVLLVIVSTCPAPVRATLAMPAGTELGIGATVARRLDDQEDTGGRVRPAPW